MHRLLRLVVAAGALAFAGERVSAGEEVVLAEEIRSLIGASWNSQEQPPVARRVVS